MKICGVDIKGSEAILAITRFTNGKLIHVPIDTKKIALADDDESKNVQSFFELAAGFIRDNDIKHIAIKKRGKKGEFAGGPTTFKIEGILQMLANCEVMLFSPQTISAQIRKHAFVIPTTLNKYQHDAYLTACAALMKAAE
ncbi:MAG: DUF3010 family protein [Methylotenera sp.]|uniref:DUF3010 family protein n=1 Tax=Methylotenera sp. TaxID=2051956 RepID=UPI002488DA4B|nr:DUF3010 family protein [Methylotenera sp.]MDI1307996.1 DUF3010 family protein [Methylotenera sp.]